MEEGRIVARWNGLGLHQGNRNFGLWNRGGLRHAGLIQIYMWEIETFNYGRGEDWVKLEWLSVK